MPLEAQTRLLRVLQEGEYTTVGGRTPIRADVPHRRRDPPRPAQLIRQGLFREDLFYRLNVVPIRLPPLRERTRGYPGAGAAFLRAGGARGPAGEGARRGGDGAAASRYRWPGNVRELENLVRRLAALYSQEVIGVEVVEAELAEAPPPAPAPAEAVSGRGAGRRRRAPHQRLFRRA